MKVKTFILGGTGDWDQQVEEVNEFLNSSQVPGDYVKVRHVLQSSAPVPLPEGNTVVTHLTIFYDGLT